MAKVLIVTLGLFAATMPAVALAQEVQRAVAKPRPPRAVLSSLIYITLRLSRDETWVYNTETKSVTGCCRGTHFPEAQLRSTMPRASSPAAVDAVKPIANIGIVVKHNGPPYSSGERMAAPSHGPLPADAVKPIPGIGIVLKKNPGTAAERTTATAADGGATLGAPPTPGTYDLTVSIPTDAMPEGARTTPVTLSFQIAVAADGSMISAWLSKKGYEYYKAQRD